MRYLVSIITPVINGEKCIAQCLSNVLDQSYDHIEHVIVDGGSSDGTVEILSDYSSRYSDRIRFISEPDNGPGDGWNKGLKMANGDVFGCLGFDDLYEQDAVESVVNYFQSNPDAYFVHGGACFVNENEEIVRKHEVEDFDYQEFANTARHIATPSAFYKRAVMERIGWLDSSGDDFDVMLRITREFEVYRVERVLSRLRLCESFFRPLDLRKRKEFYRQTYMVSRRYGGTRLSPLALRYFAAMLLCGLRLDFAFPFLHGRFEKLRMLFRRISCRN